MRFPELPKRPKLLRRKPKELSNRQIKIRFLTNRALIIIFVFLGGVGVIFAGWSVIAGTSLFIPKNAEGILKSIEPDIEYTWSSESIRLFEHEGFKTEQEAARGAIVDLNENKFQAQSAGVLPDRVYYASDGKFTIGIKESSQDDGFQVLTDVCNNAPAIPASYVEIPTPEDFFATNPSIDTDEGTFLGDRAWILNFEMTPEIFKKLLMLPLYTEVTKGSKEAFWVISDKERKSIEANDFETIEGLVWINRDGDRQIKQIDAKVEMDGGSKYRLLAQRVATNQDNLLTDMTLGKDNCDLKKAPVAGD